MRIEILESFADQTGCRHVRFKTDFGVTFAKWKCPHVPTMGTSYCVEFDIDAIVDAASNARIVEPGPPCIGGDDSHVHLRALVESADDDGVAYLRMARDATALIETSGNIAAGCTIQITVPFGAFWVTCIGH